MPEFILDHGSPEGAKAFKALDYFTRGYIEAMFFTECHADNPELDGASLDQLAALTLAEIKEVCADFQGTNANTLEAAYNARSPSYSAECAGHDFWFTRNGHGAGFWDRGLGAIGDRLSSMSRPYGSSDLYRGDDGKLYLS